MRRVCGLRYHIIALAMLVAFADIARAEAVLTKKITYFPIGGHTAEDLVREMELRGPYTHSPGIRHPGATKTKFGGDFTYVESDGRCSVQSARVTVSANIILPRWTNRKSANNRLGVVWDTFVRASLLHEEQHAEIARQHGIALEKALMALRPRRSCVEMQQAVDVLGAEALKAHDREQKRFDRSEAVNLEKRLIRMLESQLGPSSR